MTPRRLSLIVLLLALVTGAGAPRATADEPRATEWKGPAHVTQMTRADVNGDGVTDVLLASGRTVFIWSGGAGKSPKPIPRWTLPLDDDVSFAGVARGDVPGLRVLAVGKSYVLDLDGGARRDPRPLALLGWHDRTKVTFLDTLQPGGALLLPEPSGWRLEHAGGVTRIKLTADRHLTEGGPFLEDTASATRALPAVHVARSAVVKEPSLALWGLSGDTLIARDGKYRVRYDLRFLPREGDRRLVDLDGDGRPDLMHRKTSNLDGQYGFFHTTPVAKATATTGFGPTHTPARAILRLSGYQLEPDLVDLNGDGLPDFVITTIEVDAKNTLRALASGTVTAMTRAFLNRSAKPGARTFDAEPDAAIISDVGVKLRFTYAGTVEVKRSLTIVVDGDYDGDGHADLAIRTGPATLRIRRGLAKGVWEPEGRDIAIPDIGDHTTIEAYAVDTDGDDRDELLLIYRSAGTDPEQVFLLEPGL